MWLNRSNLSLSKKNKFFRSSKLSVPQIPYKIKDPNKNKLEEKAPKIKYFKPSQLKKLNLFS